MSTNYSGTHEYAYNSRTFRKSGVSSGIHRCKCISIVVFKMIPWKPTLYSTCKRQVETRREWQRNEEFLQQEASGQISLGAGYYSCCYMQIFSPVGLLGKGAEREVIVFVAMHKIRVRVGEGIYHRASGGEGGPLLRMLLLNKNTLLPPTAAKF